ncbi:MAG TPA: DUF1003 domain-containing protein [Lacibacter sp.]|nr:DUF1003 domain-containing protein [Lacibacter sp.]
MASKELKELLKTENEQLQKLNAIVEQSIEEEKLVSNKLLEFEDAHPSRSSRIADTIAAFGGSWKFIIAFLFFMLLWMVLNLFVLQHSFDAYPFILLNLILSTIAALQAPVIMMSQNRKEEKDRQRAVNDYLVNLKAEVEVKNLHHKMDLLIAEQMKTLFEIQKAQMDMMEDIRRMLKKNNGQKD